MHVVGGKDPYYPEFFEGISDEEAYRMALRETIADIRAVADFDVLGHLIMWYVMENIGNRNILTADLRMK